MRSFLVFIFFTITCLAKSQSSNPVFKEKYKDCLTKEFVTSTDIKSKSEITVEQSLLKADFDAYRNKSTTQTLSFDNEFSVELLSAVEIAKLGCPVNPISRKDKDYILPTFHMNSDGWIIALYPNQENSKYKK